MELTKEYIKRIDEYLIRMDFEYTDIRYEIVDHIASEIEENITDIDGFFTKNGLRGEFLMYMLSQDEKLTKSYEKLVKQRNWHDQLFILKAIAKEFLKIKTVFLILSSALFVFYFVKINVKTSFFSLIAIFVVLFSYSVYTYHIETKKFGKLKILHSFYIISIVLAYIVSFVANTAFNLFITDEKFTIYRPFIALAAIVLQTLILIVFIKYKTALSTKYKHLNSNLKAKIF